MLKKLVEKWQQPKSAENEAPAPIEPSLILRDVHVSETGIRTVIEVWSTGIKLTALAADQPLPPDLAENPAPEAEEIPLDSVPEEIRCQIAQKIAQLLPEISEAELNRLQGYTIRVLQQIARDQAVRVRRILADELKDSPNVPPEIIERLARDADREVALPVIEFSPLLGDAVLFDILATSRHPVIIEAISKRHRLSEKITGAIVETAHAPAITNALNNPGAQFSTPVIEYLADRSLENSDWLGPLTQRDDLTLYSLNRIARLLTHHAMEKLARSGALSQEAVQQIHSAVQTRLRNIQLDREKDAEEKIKWLKSVGKLDDGALIEALDEGQHEIVLLGLVELSGFSLDRVKRILNSRSAKAVVGLVWKCGLPMRASIPMQLRLAHVPHVKVLYARGGTDYPCTPEELEEILSHFAE